MPAALLIGHIHCIYYCLVIDFQALKAVTNMHSLALILSDVYSHLSVSWHPCNMQFMYLRRPTKETRTRKLLRPQLQQRRLKHCHHLLLQLLSLQSPLLHPKRYSHRHQKMSSARSTSGCWKRSGRSNHATLLRRTNSTKRRLFWRRSSGQSPSLVCGDFISSHAGLGCSFFSPLQFHQGCVVNLVLLAGTNGRFYKLIHHHVISNKLSNYSSLPETVSFCCKLAW